jgi:outer membrane protein assembly factor BamB
LKGPELTNILPFVIRIDVTRGLRLNPALAEARPDALRRTLEALSGVLCIEVDGVDLTAGRAEGPLLEALEGLLSALARLQAGAAAATTPLRSGELLLLLRRRDPLVLVTLVDLGPPARLPVRELAVERAALMAASLEAAAALCRALCGAPQAESLASRRLRGAARPPRLTRAKVQPPRPPEPARSEPSPEEHAPLRFLVSLDEEAPLPGRAEEPPALLDLLLPGRLLLRGTASELPVEGFPFLSLRDLVEGLGELARAAGRGDPAWEVRLGRPGRLGDLTIRLDLATSTLSLAGGAATRASPLDVGRAVRLAVERLAAQLAGRDPERAAPAELVELGSSARAAEARLAELALGDLHAGSAPPARPAPARPPSARPLALGDLRRVALRVTWQEHVGPPVGPGLAQVGAGLVALGQEALLGRCGARTWRAPGADWAVLAAGLLLVRRGDRLSALEPGSGRERWSRPLPHAHPTGAAGRRGGPLLVAEAGALSALEPGSGLPRWRFELPGGDGLALAAFGPLVAAGTGSGLLYGLGLDGRLAWRLRAPGPALAPPLLLGRTLASLHAVGPGAALLLLEASSGRRLREVPLDVTPAGPLLRFGGGLALAGRSGGAAVVILVRPSTGRAWEVEAPLTGTPRLAVAGRVLLAADASGALARLEPGGGVAWSLPPCAGSGSAAPALARGLVVAARDGVSLHDAALGRPLGSVAGLAPLRLLANSQLAIAALEADGTATGLSTAGHLSLLPGRQPAR